MSSDDRPKLNRSNLNTSYNIGRLLAITIGIAELANTDVKAIEQLKREVYRSTPSAIKAAHTIAQQNLDAISDTVTAKALQAELSSIMERLSNPPDTLPTAPLYKDDEVDHGYNQQMRYDRGYDNPKAPYADELAEITIYKPIISGLSADIGALLSVVEEIMEAADMPSATSDTTKWLEALTHGYAARVVREANGTVELALPRLRKKDAYLAKQLEEKLEFVRSCLPDDVPNRMSREETGMGTWGYFAQNAHRHDRDWDFE